MLLVVFTTAALLAVEEHSFRSDARRQLKARGAAGLEEVAGAIGELRRSHETFARLIADTPGLDSAVQRGDGPALRRLLTPLRANQRGAFEEVTAYGAQGDEIVTLGPPKGDRIDGELFDSARKHGTASAAVVDPAGLVVVASTPIRYGRRVVGVLVIATTLADADLIKLRHKGAVELAFYQGRSLVTASTRRTDLLARLRTADPSPDGLGRLNDDLGSFELYGTARRLDGGRLLALAPSADLHALPASAGWSSAARSPSCWPVCR